MEQNLCKVTIQGKEREYPYGTTYAEIVKEYEGTTEFPIVLVIVNGKLRELHKTLKKDCTVEFITLKDDMGHKAYKRSASLVLLKAVYDVVDSEKLEKVIVHYSVGSGYYYTIHGDVVLNQELLDSIKKRMWEIVDASMPIMKRSVGTDEAMEIFHKHRMYDKEKLFRYRMSSRVNLYKIGNFEDYFYGFMVNNTGIIQYFDLKLYDEGFVLELPEKQAPNVIPEFKPEEKIFQVQKESQEWIDKLHISCVGELNDKIVEEGIQNILLIQEALHEAKISDIAQRIVEEGNKKFVMVELRMSGSGGCGTV